MDIRTALKAKGVGVKGIGVKEAARQIGISRQSLWFALSGRPIGRQVTDKIVAWVNRAEDIKGEASN